MAVRAAIVSRRIAAAMSARQAIWLVILAEFRDAHADQISRSSSRARGERRVASLQPPERHPTGAWFSAAVVGSAVAEVAGAHEAAARVAAGDRFALP